MSGRAVLLGTALWLIMVSTGARAEESGGSPETHEGFLARSVEGRLAIGVRASHAWLEDDRRSDALGYDNANRQGNFLGSLWGLDPKQSYVPLPFLEYRVWSVLGVGVAYDQLRIRTLDWGDEARTWTAGDGDLRLRGAQAFVSARFSNRTRFTPYARAGFAYYWCRFLESPGWAAPGRHFEVEDTRGWLAGAGLRVRLWKGIALDGSYEHRQLREVQAVVRFSNGGKGTKGAFPTRNDVAALGLDYVF